MNGFRSRRRNVIFYASAPPCTTGWVTLWFTVAPVNIKVHSIDLRQIKSKALFLSLLPDTLSFVSFKNVHAAFRMSFSFSFPASIPELCQRTPDIKMENVTLGVGLSLIPPRKPFLFLLFVPSCVVVWQIWGGKRPKPERHCLKQKLKAQNLEQKLNLEMEVFCWFCLRKVRSPHWTHASYRLMWTVRRQLAIVSFDSSRRTCELCAISLLLFR